MSHVIRVWLPVEKFIKFKINFGYIFICLIYFDKKFRIDYRSIINHELNNFK